MSLNVDNVAAMDWFDALGLLRRNGSHHLEPSMKALAVKFRRLSGTRVFCDGYHRLSGVATTT
jgi:hypothetical protein